MKPKQAGVNEKTNAAENRNKQRLERQPASGFTTWAVEFNILAASGCLQAGSAMMHHETSLPRLYLKQCEMSILDRPTLVSTVLGSCVAVTFYNGRLGIAAISHSLLPHCRRCLCRKSVKAPPADHCSLCGEAFKYVDCSVSRMAEAFTRFGIKPGETEVRIYGGAKMFIQGSAKMPPPVGDQNLAVALKLVADHGFTLLSSDVGGPVGRKISFNTQTGKVTVHRLATHPGRDFETIDLLLKKVTRHVFRGKNPDNHH